MTQHEKNELEKNKYHWMNCSLLNISYPIIEYDEQSQNFFIIINYFILKFVNWKSHDS